MKWEDEELPRNSSHCPPGKIHLTTGDGAVIVNNIADRRIARGLARKASIDQPIRLIDGDKVTEYKEGRQSWPQPTDL